METGTTEAGCIFREHGHECRKIVETGTLMCPHHNLVTKYREEAKANPKTRNVRHKKPAQTVRDHAPRSYYNE